MTRTIVLLSILFASSCGVEQTLGPDPQPCSESWQQYIEAQLHTSDSAGHGPDVGSVEWRSVIEFKLGIRGDPAIPSRKTDEWCTYIDETIRESGA